MKPRGMPVRFLSEPCNVAARFYTIAIRNRSLQLWISGAVMSKKANVICRWICDSRLADHFALLADAALAFVGESLHTSQNRFGIEMRFSDHVGFQAAASPMIVEVGGERILVRQWPEVAQRPHASRARRNHHQIVAGFGR